MSNTFPLSSASPSEKRTARYQDAIREALAAVEAGTISNVRYGDLKSTINMQIGDAWTKTMLPLLPNHLAPDYRLASEIYGMSPQLHTAIGKAAKVEKMKLDLPIKEAALAFLAEIKPLCEAFDALKGMAKKREIKPVEDRRAKYNAPAASKSAIGVVKARLEEITQDARDKLVASFSHNVQTWLDRYLAAQTAANTEGKPLDPYGFYNTRYSKNFDPEAASVINALVESKPGRPAVQGNVYRLRENAATLMRTYCEKTADQVRENFVYKNLSKFDSIVTAKPDLASVVIIGFSVDMLGLEGTLRITFDDGAAFTAHNAVVWSRSVNGLDFQRFPLTFHNVVMAGGVKMGKPSEERMNTVFVGKAS